MEAKTAKRSAGRRYQEFKEKNSSWHARIQESVKRLDRAFEKASKKSRS